MSYHIDTKYLNLVSEGYISIQGNLGIEINKNQVKDAYIWRKWKGKEYKKAEFAIDVIMKTGETLTLGIYKDGEEARKLLRQIKW